MKSNKPVLYFLLKFFISYVVLAGLYAFYLSNSQQKTPSFTCSGITSNVANHTTSLLNVFGYESYNEQHSTELSFKMIVEGKYVSRVIEGCNAISVIILFWAFIIAFKGKVKTTIIFGLIGSLLIYIANIFRIAILSIGLLKYPEYESILHNLIFPAIIYGFVFILWLIWINKYSIKREQNA